jgi:uncharacterized membrane protein YcaP (DUF421 family)
MDTVFFKDWESIRHAAIATILAFIILFLFVRISGKRTLTKLNAFDFVVTVALGSTLAYMMLAMVSLAEGTIVLFLIILMQYVFAWGARCSRTMEKLINSVPTLVFYEGRFIEQAMRREAVTKDEIYSAIRETGSEYLSDIKAVVMELNGQLSVVKKTEGSGTSSLENIQSRHKIES